LLREPLETDDVTPEYNKGVRRTAAWDRFRRIRPDKLTVCGYIPIEITPAEVSELLNAGAPLRMIDVREPAEHAICHIEGSTLIPMQSIPQRLNELDGSEAPIVVFCHHGVRSLSVVDWLRRQGVENCRSMAGGIDLWSLRIDPAVPRY
jgi:rhodanese-related sulfurtransferase